MRNRQIVWFTAFTLLAGVQLVFDPLLPQSFPSLIGMALRFGVIAFGLLLLARPRRLEVGLVAWSGVLLLTLPVVTTAASGRVSGFTELLVFTLIPTGVVFAQAQQGGDLLSLLGPALTGFAGASLVLPYSVPVSSGGRLWLAAMLAGAWLSGFALVQVARRMEAESWLVSAAHIALGAALAAGLFCWVGWRALRPLSLPEVLVEAARLLVEMALLGLATYLIRELGAVRYAARYFLVPLAGVAISFGLARPALDGTIGLGAALMLGSSLMLLRDARGNNAGGSDTGP